MIFELSLLETLGGDDFLSALSESFMRRRQINMVSFVAFRSLLSYSLAIISFSDTLMRCL